MPLKCRVSLRPCPGPATPNRGSALASGTAPTQSGDPPTLARPAEIPHASRCWTDGFQRNPLDPMNRLAFGPGTSDRYPPPRKASGSKGPWPLLHSPLAPRSRFGAPSDGPQPPPQLPAASEAPNRVRKPSPSVSSLMKASTGVSRIAASLAQPVGQVPPPALKGKSQRDAHQRRETASVRSLVQTPPKGHQPSKQ